MGDHVRIFDTTLRDGEQAPGCTMTRDEKLEVARQLARLKVDIIEAGFPVASPGDWEAVNAIARELGTPDGPVICGLARCSRGDIESAWTAIEPAAKARIHVFISTSDIHLEHQLRMTREQVLAKAREMVTFARSLCPDIEFSPMDAGRSDPQFMHAGAGGGDRGGRDDAQHPRYGRLPDAPGIWRDDRWRSVTRFRARKMSCSRRIATTTWVWLSPTASRRWSRERGRSSVRSTGWANGLATHRWKKS